MRRVLLSLLVLALLGAACSDDAPTLEPATSEAPVVDEEVEAAPGDDEEDTASSADLEDETEVDDDIAGEALDDGDGIEDPDADIVVESPDVDELIDAANADGVVSEAEMTEILTEVGTPAQQASCEGAILAELGVTDPTDVEQLQAVADQLTEEHQIALGQCISG